MVVLTGSVSCRSSASRLNLDWSPVSVIGKNPFEALSRNQCSLSFGSCRKKTSSHTIYICIFCQLVAHRQGSLSITRVIKNEMLSSKEGDEHKAFYPRSGEYYENSKVSCSESS